MATSRLNNTTPSKHTISSILAKLDTDLSDAERKCFVNILLESPQTTNLLLMAGWQWEIELAKQKIKIETLKEYIRVKNCAIKNYEDSKLFGYVDYINKMQKSSDEDAINLEKIESAYNKSRERADKTIKLNPEIDNEVKLSLKK